MTIRELVYNIQNLINKGRQSDDNNLSDKQVEFIINYHRARILEEDLRRQRKIDAEFLQRLNCLKLIRVDMAECCQVEIGCPILRTELALPKYNRLTVVAKLDGTPLSESNQIRMYWDKYSRFTADSIKWFDVNNYIYLTNNNLMKWISATGAFEDPRAVEELNACDNQGNPCVVDDFEYPLPMKFVSELTQRIIKGEMYTYGMSKEDKTNDAADSPKS